MSLYILQLPPVLQTVDISGTLRQFVFALFVTELVADLFLPRKVACVPI